MTRRIAHAPVVQDALKRLWDGGDREGRIAHEDWEVVAYEAVVKASVKKIEVRVDSDGRRLNPQ